MKRTPLASAKPKRLTNERRQGGVQSVRRAIALMEALSVAPSDGERLSRLADMADLDRGTTRRLLATLVDGGLVEQDEATKRYQLGMAFFTLAAAASNRWDLQDVARTSLRKIATATGDTAFLSVRSGDDAVCVDIQTGSYPVQTLPMDLGSRRPLGAGATGIAFLAALPDEEVERLLDRNRERLEVFPGQDRASIKRQLTKARERNYSVGPERGGIAVNAVAVPLINRRGRPVACMTVAAIPERLKRDRAIEVAETIREEAQKIQDIMWRLPDSERHRSSWAGLTVPADD